MEKHGYLDTKEFAEGVDKLEKLAEAKSIKSAKKKVIKTKLEAGGTDDNYYLEYNTSLKIK